MGKKTKDAAKEKDKAGTKKGDKKSPKADKVGKGEKGDKARKGSDEKEVTSPKSGASGSPKTGRGKSRRSSAAEKAEAEAEAEAQAEREALEAAQRSTSPVRASVAGFRKSVSAASASLAARLAKPSPSGGAVPEEPGVEDDQPLLPEGGEGAEAAGAEGAPRRERSSPPGMMGRMCGSLSRLTGRRSRSAPPKPSQSGEKPAGQPEEPGAADAPEDGAGAEPAGEAAEAEEPVPEEKPVEEDDDERPPGKKTFLQKLLPGKKPTKAQQILFNHGERDARLAAEAEAMAAAAAAAEAARAEAEAEEAAAAAALAADAVSDGAEEDDVAADAGDLAAPGEGEEEEAVEADPEEDGVEDPLAAKPEGDGAAAEEEAGEGEPQAAAEASGLLSEEELAEAEAFAGDAEDHGLQPSFAVKADDDVDLDEAEERLGAEEDSPAEGLVTEEEMAAVEGDVGAEDGEEAPDAGEEMPGAEAEGADNAARPEGEAPLGTGDAAAEPAAAGADAAAVAGVAVAAAAVAPPAAATQEGVDARPDGGEAKADAEVEGIEEEAEGEPPRSDDVEIAFNVEEERPPTKFTKAARFFRQAGKKAQITAVLANSSYRQTQKSVNRSLRGGRKFARDAVYKEEDGEVVMKTAEEMARDGAAGAAKQARRAGRATVAGAQAGGRAAAQGVQAGVERARSIKLPAREDVQPAWMTAAGAYVKLKLGGQKPDPDADADRDGDSGDEVYSSELGVGDDQLSVEPTVISGDSGAIKDVEVESTASEKAKKKAKLRLKIRTLEPPPPAWDPELWDDENAIAELHAAALQDDALRIRFLLHGLDMSRCIPADLPNEKGETPAVVAAKAGCVVSCAALLDGGANPLARDKEAKNYGDGIWPDELRPDTPGKRTVPNIPNGRTVVYHLQQQKLLNEVLARVFPLTKVRMVCAMAEHLAKHYEMSALSAAVKQNQPELLRLLLAHASMFPESMQQPPPLEEDTPRSEVTQAPRALVKNLMKDRDGRATALLHTVNMQRWKCADVILDAGVPSATLDTTADKDGRNALHLAAIAGRAALVRRLLKAGASPSMYSNGGRQPLHDAASMGHAEVVQALIQQGRVDTLAKTREARGVRAPGAKHELAADRLVIEGNTAFEIAQSKGKTAVCDILQQSPQAVAKQAQMPMTPQAYARRDWEDRPAWSLPKTASSRRPLPTFEDPLSPSALQARLAWTQPPLTRGKAVGPIDWGPLAAPPPPSLKGTRAGLRGDVVVVSPPYIASPYTVPMVQA